MSAQQKVIRNLQVNDELPPFEVQIETRKYRKYNRLIKEINPLHISKTYAQKLGFKDVVVAGNFLFTYLPKWIINWTKNPKIIDKITIQFKNPIYLEEKIIHKGKVKEIREKDNKKVIVCEYHVEKEDGTLTSKGEILLNCEK